MIKPKNVSELESTVSLTVSGLSDDDKRRVLAERSQMEAEYGNDFELIQKYCIEKIIRRNSTVNHSLIGKCTQ